MRIPYNLLRWLGVGLCSFFLVYGSLKAVELPLLDEVTLTSIKDKNVLNAPHWKRDFMKLNVVAVEQPIHVIFSAHLYSESGTELLQIGSRYNYTHSAAIDALRQMVNQLPTGTCESNEDFFIVYQARIEFYLVIQGYEKRAEKWTLNTNSPYEAQAQPDEICFLQQWVHLAPNNDPTPLPLNQEPLDWQKLNKSNRTIRGTSLLYWGIPVDNTVTQVNRMIVTHHVILNEPETLALKEAIEDGSKTTQDIINEFLPQDPSQVAPQTSDSSLESVPPSTPQPEPTQPTEAETETNPSEPSDATTQTLTEAIADPEPTPIPLTEAFEPDNIVEESSTLPVSTSTSTTTSISASTTPSEPAPTTSTPIVSTDPEPQTTSDSTITSTAALAEETPAPTPSETESTATLEVAPAPEPEPTPTEASTPEVTPSEPTPTTSTPTVSTDPEPQTTSDSTITSTAALAEETPTPTPSETESTATLEVAPAPEPEPTPTEASTPEVTPSEPTPTTSTPTVSTDPEPTPIPSTTTSTTAQEEETYIRPRRRRRPGPSTDSPAPPPIVIPSTETTEPAEDITTPPLTPSTGMTPTGWTPIPTPPTTPRPHKRASTSFASVTPTVTKRKERVTAKKKNATQNQTQSQGKALKTGKRTVKDPGAFRPHAGFKDKKSYRNYYKKASKQEKRILRKQEKARRKQWSRTKKAYKRALKAEKKSRKKRAKRIKRSRAPLNRTQPKNIAKNNKIQKQAQEKKRLNAAQTVLEKAQKEAAKANPQGGTSLLEQYIRQQKALLGR